MKAVALARKAPLRRKTRIRARRATPRRSSRERSPDYMAFVRTLPCRAVALPTPPGGCYGAIHAHHAGERGLGQKADDSTCIALCASHHTQWHDASGAFAAMDRAARAEWAAAQVGWTQAQWAEALRRAV